MRRFITAVFVPLCLCALPGILKAEQAQTGRTWTYVYMQGNLDPDWSLVIMPGAKYEFARNGGSDTIGFYVYELFVGPQYTVKWDDFTLTVPFWYYYVGMPYKPLDDYYYTHNLSVSPRLTWRRGRLSLYFRLFTYNTLYSNYYDNADERRGYSLMTTQMLGVSYGIGRGFSIEAGDEIFTGIIDDGGTAASGFGFIRTGFQKNKLYAGLSYSVMKGVSLKLQYVNERNYNTDLRCTENHHLIYTVMSLAADFFSRDAGR